MKPSEIPEEFKTKSREELYMDIIMLSAYVQKLKHEMDNLKGEMHLKNGEMIKKRAENFKLKSHIGLQNIQIQDLNNKDKNIIDISYEETDRDNSTE